MSTRTITNGSTHVRANSRITSHGANGAHIYRVQTAPRCQDIQGPASRRAHGTDQAPALSIAPMAVATVRMMILAAGSTASSALWAHWFVTKADPDQDRPNNRRDIVEGAPV